MKNLYLLLIIIIAISCKKNTSTQTGYPIKQVEIRSVILTDNFWLPRIKQIQEVTIPFAFNKCEEEGRMESFLIAGGVKEGKVCGKMPFDDTDLYKTIEGASYSLISNPDPELDAYIDSIIEIINIGQEDDGYLTTWFTIDPMNPPAWWVSPSGKRWLNPGGHELYNSGHMFEAAAAHYWATGKRNFLDIALKNADLLVKDFGPGKLEIPPGHQIVETGLIKLYQITNKKEYLELAKFFLDQRGKDTTINLGGAYAQDHIPVIEQKEAVGHAVRALYMYAGMTDIAAMYNDSAYLNAVNAIWNNVINKKIYITGGLGARHEGESFGDNYELPNLTAYCETCAAIGSVYWNYRLFLLTGDPKYIDVIEKTMYNGLISGISLDGIKFFYPNALESDGEYKFNHGAATRQPWFDCTCCPTNLIRFIPSIPSLVYATQEDNVFVNLYMSNKTKVNINGQVVEIIQETEYPLNGNIQLTVNPEKKKKFTVKLRVPGWFQNKPLPGNLYQYIGDIEGKMVVKLNDEELNAEVNNGYIELSKKWEKGDKIEVIFPMEVRKVIADEKVVDDQNKIALEYGPFVYCAEEIDNIEFDQIAISENQDFKIEEKPDILGGINIITPADEKNVYVPYYAWSNRGVGKMKVWFQVKSEN